MSNERPPRRTLEYHPLNCKEKVGLVEELEDRFWKKTHWENRNYWVSKCGMRRVSLTSLSKHTHMRAHTHRHTYKNICTNFLVNNRHENNYYWVKKTQKTIVLASERKRQIALNNNVTATLGVDRKAKRVR